MNLLVILFLDTNQQYLEKFINNMYSLKIKLKYPLSSPPRKGISALDIKKGAFWDIIS